MNEKLQKALYCLNCQGLLGDSGGNLKCLNCHKEYLRSGNSIVFTETQNFFSKGENSTDSAIFRIKNYLKRNPKIFKFLYHLIYPPVGKTANNFAESLPKDALIINLGSGVMNISSRVIDVDYLPYPNVSVVADVTHLPFRDGSIDAVISESLLEHVADPDKVVAEVKRVLRPNGLVYIVTPFMLGFHSSPNDYRRWTAEGLKELWKDFNPEEVGVAFGPTSAMTTLVIECLAMLLSFGNKILYQAWLLCLMVFLIPVNWLDFILSRYEFSTNNAMALYFIAHKK